MTLHTQPAVLDAIGGIDPYAQFRVSSSREIVALLKQLVTDATPVHLSGPHGANLTTVIWTVDPAQGRVNFSADADSPQLQALLEHEEATCVAYLDAVKLQFDADHLVLVRAATSCALQGNLPREMYRFQRRSTFRVRTLGRGTPTAIMRHPSMPEMQLGLRVLECRWAGARCCCRATCRPCRRGSKFVTCASSWMPTRASTRTCSCTMSRRSRTRHGRRDWAVNSCTCSHRPSVRSNGTLIKHRSAGGFCLSIERHGSELPNL